MLAQPMAKCFSSAARRDASRMDFSKDSNLEDTPLLNEDHPTCSMLAVRGAWGFTWRGLASSLAGVRAPTCLPDIMIGEKRS